MGCKVYQNTPACVKLADTQKSPGGFLHHSILKKHHLSAHRNISLV